MTVDLTPPEKHAVAQNMRAMAWGGTPEILLAQASLYEKLGLAAFAGEGTPAVESVPVELTANEATILTAVCASKGQPFDIGLLSAAILRRLVLPPAAASQ